MTAQNGPKGIAVFLDQSPDVVITDMRMPGVDGAEVIRTLLRINMRARIIAVSSAPRHIDVDYFRLAPELGAEAAVHKLDSTERILVEVDVLLKASG